MKKIENGIIPVMMQPFHADGSLDWDGLSELVEFYLSAGSVALFSACASTEVSHLSRQEILDVVRKTVELAAGRVPVIAGAICLNATVEKQAEFVREIASYADFVAITASMMADESDDETVFLERIYRLLTLTDDIPLAVYEAPQPYHRLMPPETLRELALTGRFYFHKDTCCNASVIRRKIEAAEGTPLRFFNANSPTLLDSLQAGGAGYSGVGTNFYPEVYAELCSVFADDPERATEIQRFLDEEELLLANDAYPQSAKMFLQQRGLNLSSRIRLDRSISFADASTLIQGESLYKQFMSKSVGAGVEKTAALAGA